MQRENVLRFSFTSPWKLRLQTTCKAGATNLKPNIHDDDDDEEEKEDYTIMDRLRGLPVDAIMGQLSPLSYKYFIFITEYLFEVDRIKSITIIYYILIFYRTEVNTNTDFVVVFLSHDLHSWLINKPAGHSETADHLQRRRYHFEA